ncbi:MAG: hypothetical protein CSA95_05225 [Bacteroidetes bacterium]|nr:MAG: hypothetical protein CSA95_05225 [Bacteroidota bacterium]PIE88242.1 MAG: hypothetical protein CSA04_02985 [Bacteroidota bacterium]
MKKSIFHLAFILITLLSMNRCGVYSFTGASLDPNIQSINIHYFDNKARLINPMLSQVFSDAIKDRFISQTSLELTNDFADLYLEGYISDYKITPQAIQAGETAAMNRLTITVKVTFTNNVNTSQSFEQSFSQYADFPSTEELSTVENQLIEEITEYLVDAIFNKAVVNW